MRSTESRSSPRTVVQQVAQLRKRPSGYVAKSGGSTTLRTIVSPVAAIDVGADGREFHDLVHMLEEFASGRSDFFRRFLLQCMKRRVQRRRDYRLSYLLASGSGTLEFHMSRCIFHSPSSSFQTTMILPLSRHVPLSP